MDPPESPPAGQHSSATAAAALYEDSPVFDFINTLSPLETLKPPNSVRSAQLFKPSEFPPVSSIFVSPQVNPDKQSQLTARDSTVRPSQKGSIVDCKMSQMGTSTCIEMSGSTNVASENCSMDSYINETLHQSQLVSNGYLLDTFKVPMDNMLMDSAISKHQYGMHRRSLFNEKPGASGMSVQSVSNLHPASICADSYLRLAGSPACASLGIGLHLNSVASISKEIMPYNNQAAGDPYNIMPFAINPSLVPEHNSPMKSVISGSELVPYSSEVETYIQSDHSSLKTTPSAAKSGKQSHKKRRKFQHGDGDSCRRCNCKKSKCLKLYCACFAAKVYCSELCSCQGCLNNHAHEEVVSCTRRQTESRNPLAFAPNVIRTCGFDQEFGDNSNKTPASARHKRGCNCKKSYCLKKYCECFQERFLIFLFSLEGVLLLNGNGSHAKEERLEFDKQLLVGQSVNLPSSENMFTTPSIGPYRSSVLLPSMCSRPSLSSTGCSSPQHNSQSPMKTDVLLAHLDTYSAEMIFGDGPSGNQEGNSSCNAGVKVVSPNKKRVLPLHSGTGLSPINRSGRKLILKSIPSFPSLTGDVNTEPH
ncbi:hypothetical protein EJB05_52267 [Eragrostis curvula]|uniref:CRC domain-containing protein n=1 Tax=Eragrostis curvula TaxID=38414 RepID=A0A5J9STC5_9POAL|nr:hypothetical protein EJB05_52267 [Eragrostis curvula]